MAGERYGSEEQQASGSTGLTGLKATQHHARAAAHDAITQLLGSAVAVATRQLNNECEINQKRERECEHVRACRGRKCIFKGMPRVQGAGIGH